MNRRRLVRAVVVLAAAIIVMSLAACAPAAPAGLQEHAVFAPRWYTDFGPTTTKTDMDVGIPELVNSSNRPVRILSARFASAPPAVVTNYVAAYSNQNGNTEVGIGNLLKAPCRQHYTPFSVTKDVVPPHGIGGLYIILGFTIKKPGTYHLKWVRITYTTAGHRYWQDVSIGLTEYVTKGKALPSTC